MPASPKSKVSETAVDVELIDVTKRFGSVTAVDHVALQIAQGSFYSLLGPSGCGKTTTLRMIAGFEQPTEGEILVAGIPVAGVPPYRRNVNTVFQHYALFPHMDVARNVGYGLRQVGVTKDEERRRVGEALDLVRLAGYDHRRTWELSGGQQQRVALARALVNRPTVLLLDEPLGALDLKLRKEMQLELKSLQQELGITFVYVTHDQDEALTMSDVIVVMRDGRVQQQGSPEALYERPVNQFVAGFIGQSNSIPGRLSALDLAAGTASIQTGSGLRLNGRITDQGARPALGDEAIVAIRPERLEIAHGTPDASLGWTSVTGHIRQETYLGDQTEYRLETDVGQLVARRSHHGRADNASVRTGEPITVRWPDDANLVLVA